MKKKMLRKYLETQRDFYRGQMDHMRDRIPPATRNILELQKMTFADRYIYYKGEYEALGKILDIMNEESEVN